MSEREIWRAALVTVDEAVHPTDEAALSKSQTRIARELGVTLSSVRKALEKPGTRYLKLQLRIVGHLSDFQVEGPIYIAALARNRGAIPDCSPSLPIASVRMRHSKRLSERAIWRAALVAVEEAVYPIDEATAPRTQTQIARELGVTPSAVTKALARPGTRCLKLQLRIVEHLTEYRIEGPIYVAVRKGA